jgi:hypothetical protein
MEYTDFLSYKEAKQAAFRGDILSLQKYLKMGRGSKDNRGILSSAIKGGDIPTVQYILSLSFWNDYDCPHYSWGMEKVIAKYDRLSILKVFLERMKDSDELPQFEDACMDSCIRYCNLPGIKLLHQRGTVVTWRDIYNIQKGYYGPSYSKHHSKDLIRSKNRMMKYLHNNNIPKRWPCLREDTESVAKEIVDSFDREVYQKFVNMQKRKCRWCRQNQVREAEKMWKEDINREKSWIGWLPEEVMLDIYEIVKL